VGGGTLAFLGGLWVSLPAAMAALLAAFVAALALAAHRHFRERAAVFQLFGMHLSPRIADIAWAERRTFLDRGLPPAAELTATVLVADLAGFMGATERLPPEALLRWINRYVGTMTALIDQGGGIVEKYAGDGITAVFGIPIPRRDQPTITADARAAAATALAMTAALDGINRANGAEGLPPMRMRLGLSTGRLVAGTVGGPGRLQYTVLGDAVNVGARLESYRKETWTPGCEAGHSRILLTAATLERLGDDFAVVPYDDAATIRGRGAPIAVYELVGRATTGEESAHA
jgi:adenylate cyclase